MSKAWRRQDLGGGGLQQANLRLARALRRRWLAYLLLALFPLGAHRFYLRRPLGGALLLGLSGAALLLLNAGLHDAALTIFGIQAGVALFDLLRLEKRLVALNKALRMAAYLRAAPGAPAGFRGQYTDDGRGERERPASFADEERRLAGLERKKRDGA